MKHNLKFSLPNHAITNLRQYAPPSDLLPMDDDTLRMKLDDKLREAVGAGRVYEAKDDKDGSPIRYVLLDKEDFGAELTALLKPDAYDQGKEAVVTIFPTSARESRLRQAALTPAPAPPAEPFDPNTRLVSYRAKSHTASKSHTTYEQVDRAAVKDKIAGLVQGGVDPDTIRVWKPVELKVARRVEVDVDFGEDG